MQDNSDIEAQVARHAGRNRELVALITSKGGDLQLERTVDLHFWASQQGAAAQLAKALAAAGVSDVHTSLSKSESGLWNVEGHVRESVVTVVDPEFVEKFVRIAQTFEGRFEGWGTSL